MKTYLKLILLTMFLVSIVLSMVFPYFSMTRSMLSGTLFLLLAYLVLKKEVGVIPPFSISCLFILSVFADSAGNTFNFYGQKWGPLWYDSWVHLFISFCISLFLSWLLNILVIQKKIRIQKSLVSFFAFSIGVSISAFYEVIELWDDLYFGGKRIWGAYDSAQDLQWGIVGTILGILTYKTILRIKQKSKKAEK